MAKRGNWVSVLLLLLVALGFWAEGSAEVTLPRVLADHMVVQRDMPVHIWGYSDPGERVVVAFRENHAEDTADNLGYWSVHLPPGNAGGPFALSIKGTNSITLTDILVGDVWVASGQSNMEFPVGINPWWKLGVLNADRELASANEPTLRLFRVDEQYSELPRTDVSADKWTFTTSQSVSDFSAVAYFFGRELVQRENIPIGLIQATVGASPIEAWTSLAALAKNSTLMPIFSVWSDEAKEQAIDERKHELELRTSAVEGQQQADSTPSPGKRSRFIAEAYSKRYFAPAYLFNAMIAPVTPFPIRGAIWYQGEANALNSSTAPLYIKMLPLMIANWRDRWGEGDFPFLYVQLANFDLGTNSEGWATVREAQRRTLNVAHTGMAVAVDIGDPADIHPRNKQEVGHRLALWARASVYGERVEFSGPLFRQADREGSHMRVRFDHAEDGLMVKGAALKAFEVAGVDRKFVPASASIDGNTVDVAAQSVMEPVYVRFGWSGNPDCNLYNSAGLPASPFSSQP
jgi:sialate O-acetylesterase